MAPKFSLQNVLDIRHGKVELLEVELGRLVSSRQEKELQLSSLRELQSLLLHQLDRAQSDEIDLVQSNFLRLNVLQVNSYIESTRNDLIQLSQAVEEKRAELVRAKQSEETLEILKRKRYEVYAAEQLQIEARLQDDIYIARAFHNQRQGA